MLQSKTHSDLLGRLMGIVILIAGVGLLGIVFTYANQLFHSPIAGLSTLNRSQTPPPPAAIGSAVGQFVAQILVLGLMTAIGSVIASKGIDMYFAANHTHRVEHHETPVPNPKHE